ncbi:hypothetical protein N0V88_003586 [Collariella sp. IMI 366227]|nr:hypothetical protein N0V88_003586 [Collariella sp. IMI 366227]
MAKGKAGAGVQNRAIYSRISFLEQAAVALSAIQHSSSHSNDVKSAAAPKSLNQPRPLEGMSRRLATDLRAVSLKTRIRLQPAVKRTICKFCDSVLVDGKSCTSTIENKSKGARKPWADALVRKCHTCGRERRYPVNAARPRRKTDRGLDAGSGHSPKKPQKG